MSEGRFGTLPIDQLELDTGNPRIARWVEMYGGNITAEQMGLALGAADSQAGEAGGTTFSSLKESIRTNRGIIHPIIVSRNSEGRLIVIEGNTRTLIYREFRDKGVDGNWDLIPAIVYDGLPDDAVEAIRLQAHLVGPRPWDPYSKAKYLQCLRDSNHLTLDQIVDFCGGQKREVQDYIAAYEDMEHYYRPLLDTDSDFDPTRFSAFVELQRTRIQKALLDSGFAKTDFAKWVNDGLISPLATVRQLPRILASEKSREVFLSDGAQEAVKLLDAPTTDTALHDAPLESLAKELIRKVLGLSYGDIQRLRANLGNDQKDILIDARDQLSQLCTDIGADG